ncbi:hypothetical protein TNIN_160601 [Trichonephila inaurata madagascariensis]|uniref:Uncharacterized protein n=1 Tax=Trichonephila inaurata madagascariensis TaxID=2747483 RepID=A0A8X6X0R8_9ARAC|nr:hypothetical protein TNIN_160601 [Trichonephila inaurata madagascariensis]
MVRKSEVTRTCRSEAHFQKKRSEKYASRKNVFSPFGFFSENHMILSTLTQRRMCEKPSVESSLDAEALRNYHENVVDQG